MKLVSKNTQDWLRTKMLRGWRKLAARPSFRKINQFLFEGSLHGLGILNFQDEQISGERHFVHNLLPQYLSPNGSTILDVGGNVGDYCEMMCKQFPGSNVFSFEPNPKNFQKLQKLQGAHSNLKALPFGLGSEVSTLKFYDRADNDGASVHGSLYKEVIEELHDVESVETEVEIKVLDQFCKQENISKIGLLKIDTEGHEFEVLKGAQEILEGGQVDLIHIEFNEMNLVSRVFFRDFCELLSDFVPFRLLPSGVLQLDRSPLKTELFGFQNIIFVHQKFRPNKHMIPSTSKIAA